MGLYKHHLTSIDFNEKINLDTMKIKILEEDKSTWARLYWLDVKKDATYFTNEAQALDYEGTNRFSKMKLVEKLSTSLVTLKNLAPEINGTTGFSVGAANGSEGWRKYSAASFQLTGTTSAEITAQSSAATVPLINGHTYYARVEIKQSTKQGTGEMFLGGSTAGGGVAAPPIITGQAVTAANTWTPISGVAVRTFPTGNHKFRLDYNNGGTSGGTMCFDGLVIIDLTECFGAGKEPTKAWCDSNIPYFRNEIIVDASSANYKKWEFMLDYPTISKNNIYNELTYIQSSGTQYINTGLTTNQDTRIVIRAAYTANYSIYGAGKAFTNFTAGGSGGYFYYNDYGPGSSTPVDYKNYSHVFEQDKNECFVDGNLVHTFATATFTSPGNLFLFGRNDGTGALNDAGGQVTIFYCQIYDGNENLLRDFIPCRKILTNEIGLFDRVQQKFYANNGTGVFIAGSTTETFSVPLYNRWTQTGSPNESAPGGYQSIKTSWTSHAGPLRKYPSADRIWDCDNGALGPANQMGSWFNPIGQLKGWTTGTSSIPSADGTAQYEIELWVRIDNLAPAKKAQIYKNNNILAKDFYEY